MDEAALRRLGREGDRGFRLVVVGSGEIGGARQKFRQRRHDRLDRQFGRFAGGDVLRRLQQRLLVRPQRFRQGGRPFMPQAWFEFSALAVAELGELRLPFLARRHAAAAGCAPGFQHVVRHRKRFQCNAEFLLGALQLFGAERLAVGLGGAGPGRRAVADRGLAGDHCRLVGFLGADDGGPDGLLIVAVDQLGGPAGGLEALHLVDRVRDRGRAVDRNAVVVVQHDQLVELPVPCHGDRFLRDALHQVAVGSQHIGVVADDLLAEFGGEHLLGQRHADRCRDALAERTRRGFDAAGLEVFRMSRRLGAEYPEVPDLVERHLLVAGQVQQRIHQHRAVSGGQHEPVAVRPFRVGGVEFQELREQHGGDVGGAHRQAGMAGFGLLDGVHGKATNRICHTGMIDLRHDENPPEMRCLVAIRIACGCRGYWPEGKGKSGAG